MKKSKFTGTNHIANEWSRKHNSYSLNTDGPVLSASGDRLNKENKEMKNLTKRNKWIY